MRMDYTVITEILVINLVGQSGVVVSWGVVELERILLLLLIKLSEMAENKMNLQME
jgi:hypothetical protein